MLPIDTSAVLADLSRRLAETGNGAVAQVGPVTGIALGGDPASWSAVLPAYPIARVEYGQAPDGPTDLSASFRLGYDRAESALYVAVEVTDDSAVFGTTGKELWDSQDGCELYLDPCLSGSPVQYDCYMDQPSVTRRWDLVAVSAGRTASGWIYEWRIELPEVGFGPAIGFDVAVADKDEDGSFSWVAWGPGTQKAYNPGRCGAVLLVDPLLKLGQLAGRVVWREIPGEGSGPFPRRVRCQPLDLGRPWIQAEVDPAGAYCAVLPAGAYAVSAVDAMDRRIVESDHVDALVEADARVDAQPLATSPLPEPRWKEKEGILAGSRPLDLAQIDRFVRQCMDYLRIPGLSLALVREGAVVYRRGYGVKSTTTQGPVTESTPFEAASMTKPIFAFAVLRLVDRGVMQLDVPLHEYLPYPDAAHDERYKRITARMVLGHSTGFPNWRTGPALNIEFDPGTRFGYSGEGFEYLKAVVGHLTGKNPEQVVREEVLDPLGMDNAYLTWRPELEALTAFGHLGERHAPMPKWKPDQPVMASSLQVDAGTYGRFLVALIEGRGLSPARLAEMLTPQPPSTANGMLEGYGGVPGLGVFIQPFPCGTGYGHGGNNNDIFTSQFWVHRDRRLGYVFLTNSGQGGRLDQALRAFLIDGASEGADAG